MSVIALTRINQPSKLWKALAAGGAAVSSASSFRC